MARWAAEKEGRESPLLPTESRRVHRCQMDPSDPLPLPPDIGTRLRGRGRAGGTGPNALLLLLLMSPEPLPPLPPILLPSAVVPSVALSGSDLLPDCVVVEKAVEFEGPTGAWVSGVTIAFSVSSSSSESERAVTKLPVRSEAASS